MNSERMAFLAFVTVALLAALVAAPAAARDVTANGTLADDENLNLTTAGDTLTLLNDDPGLAAADGAVTITASGTGTYYMGEEITLSGTNTDSGTTYLFLTGPNLGTNGVTLVDPGVSVVNGSADTFTSVAVEADDTWIYRWDTSSLPRTLDAGGYTIYAVSEPRSKNTLSGVPYATTSVQLRAASLTTRPSGTILSRGDEYRLTGTATGSPDGVQIWILGPDYYDLGVHVAVKSDTSFEYVLAGAETEYLKQGRYYVIVQHPMNNGFGVNADSATGRIYGNGIVNVTLTYLQAAEAANALINALDSPNVDDAYIKLSFTLDESWILIDGLGDQTYGETFTVTGTTDSSPGTVLAYWIATRDRGAISLSGETVVSNNGGWSIDLDTTAIGPGAYAFHITVPDGRASATVLFDIYDDITHPLPPGGGSYRVERVEITPSRDELSPGREVALDGIVGLDCPIGSRYPSTGSERLTFSTDIEDSVWSYNLKVGGNMLYTEPMVVTSRSFALSSWDLDYPRTHDVRVLLTLSGTVPETAGTQDPVLLRIVQRDSDGRVVPESEYRLPFTPAGDDPAPPFGDTLTLSPGWNFISVPRPLAAGNDTAAIFAGVNTGGRSALRYNTAAGNWTALMPTARLAPLEGFWIYSAGPAAIPLNFSTALPAPPAERTLVRGWNAVGVTGSTPATARDTLYSVNREWSTLIGFNARSQSFESGIVNGGSDANADTRSVYPGRGYWLHMTGPGTLCALGV